MCAALLRKETNFDYFGEARFWSRGFAFYREKGGGRVAFLVLLSVSVLGARGAGIFYYSHLQDSGRVGFDSSFPHCSEALAIARGLQELKGLQEAERPSSDLLLTKGDGGGVR